MELKELYNKTLELFSSVDSKELIGNIKQTILNNDNEKYRQFKMLVNDLSVDWLQMIFQYYEADRKEKKQDYTPKSICTLCSTLTKNKSGNIVYDVCAGSGALIIQKWVQNNDKFFICEELDENVIPILLFNMAIRNMNGFVINGNALTDEYFSFYKVEKGIEFSKVIKADNIEFTADEILSNPPYNIRYIPMLFNNTNCYPLPPDGNANFAFVFKALSKMNDNGKCAFVLPCGVLTSTYEFESRKFLIENGLIEKVIVLPNKMFESTDISTCVLLFSKNNKNIRFFDLREKATKEERLQNGQFGGDSHTKRTYKKIINTLSDETINEVVECCCDIKEFSKEISINDILNNNCILKPSDYIEFEYNEQKHRNLQEIADNINYIKQMRNSCKLILNETIAKNIGLDIDAFNEDKKQSLDMKKQMKEIGINIESDDYITFTKNKNEFVFKCNDKKDVPSQMMNYFQVWKNQISILNVMENKYLEELRDSLLPDLLSGKIKL